VFQRILTLLLSLILSVGVLAGTPTTVVGHCCRDPVGITSVQGGTPCHPVYTARAHEPGPAPLTISQDARGNCGHACPHCICGGTPTLTLPMAANDSVAVHGAAYIAPWYWPTAVPAGQVTRLERPPSVLLLS
jgi:hypothetical protein